MATLLQDNFTDANSTNITSHTMDVGPGWSSSWSNAADIQSNQYNPIDPGSYGSSYTDAGAADYTASLDVIIGASPADAYLGMIVRFALGAAEILNSGYLVCVYEQGDSVNIVEVPSFTVRASASKTINTSTTYNISVVASGTTLTLSVDGVEQCSYSSASVNSSSSLISLRGPASQRYDNFLVTGGAAITADQWHPATNLPPRRKQRIVSY